MLFIAHSAEAVGTGSYKNAFQSSPASSTSCAKFQVRVGNLRAFFTCPSAVRISRHSRCRLAFKMYGHPICGGCVAHAGAKNDFALILYPWFRRRFRTVFDRCWRKRQSGPSILMTLLCWRADSTIQEGPFS